MLDRLGKFGVAYGSDLSLHALSFCRGRGYHKLFISELQDCPLVSESFDMVVAIDVIEHIEEDLGALENVTKILNLDGTLILSTPNRLSRYRKADTHVREYTPRELKVLLKSVFKSVMLVNYEWQEISQFDNPIIALCEVDNARSTLCELRTT